ncbi:MAG: ribosomal RNA small subunit methyltransferase A, partial [Desulfovibrionaceae bacterium]|nr:ribosomal RNA small subunit methyltransferase A [Desulfovibrionaceae bacterium]
MQSPKICQRIVDLLTVDAQTKILEIGPGHGALTSYLEQLGAKYLLLVEKDASLALERQKVLSSNAQCVLLDALNFPWERLDEAWVVVGNLPYNIASPLMYDLVSQAPLFKQAVFMLQKEVAERVCASPKCKAYGALSIWMQSFGVPKYAFKVAPSCFWPIPKVDSAVIAYVPKREP